MTYKNIDLERLLFNSLHKRIESPVDKDIDDIQFIKKLVAQSDACYSKGSPHKCDASDQIRYRVQCYASAETKELYNQITANRYIYKIVKHPKYLPPTLWINDNGFVQRVRKSMIMFSKQTLYLSDNRKTDYGQNIINKTVLAFERKDHALESLAAENSYYELYEKLTTDKSIELHQLFEQQLHLIKINDELKIQQEEQDAKDLLAIQKDFMRWTLDKDEGLLLKLLFIELDVNTTSLFHKDALEVLTKEAIATLKTSYNSVIERSTQ